MQNTESGRKLNQAMASTGRAVATTSKAVGKNINLYLTPKHCVEFTIISYSYFFLGGAFSQAKGAFSSWFNNLLVSPEPVQKGVEALLEPNEQEKIDAEKAIQEESSFEAVENMPTISNDYNPLDNTKQANISFINAQKQIELLSYEDANNLDSNNIDKMRNIDVDNMKSIEIENLKSIEIENIKSIDLGNMKSNDPDNIRSLNTDSIETNDLKHSKSNKNDSESIPESTRNIPDETSISKDCKEVVNGIILNETIEHHLKETIKSGVTDDEAYIVGKINTV